MRVILTIQYQLIFLFPDSAWSMLADICAVCSLLDAELVQEALDELTRLMPNSDPKQTLRRNPAYVTMVERGPKRLGPHPDS